jgi:hypothetical protein
MLWNRVVCAISGSILVGTAAYAYEIKVRRLFINKYDVHETITTMATNCLQPAAPGASPPLPSNCWKNLDDIKNQSRKGGKSSYSDIEKASRWSDDPTRQDRKLSFAKIGYNIFRGCAEWIKKDRHPENAGLLCSSHYGKLQFLHAQAIDEDKGQARNTHQRIMQWADFAFRAARNERGSDGASFLDANFCSTIDGEPEGLKEAMQCRPDGRWAEWTVRTFFALTCRNPVSSANCGEPADHREGDRRALLAARGALLHLVQDSFSQSHTSRSLGAPIPHTGKPEGFTSKVVCAYPTAYFNYRFQELDAPGQHKKADKPPQVREGCDDDPRTAAQNDPQTDDVVKASAMVLWHLEHGTRATLRGYLVARVFGPEPAG